MEKGIEQMYASAECSKRKTERVNKNLIREKGETPYKH
jgi:hypothetical protein